MSDHEFERQVQEKMDELKFSPSADVWKGVALELDRDRKRRRAIYWWPAAILLLLAVGGYFVYDGKESGSRLASKSVTVKEPTHSNSSQPSTEIVPGAGTIGDQPITQKTTDHIDQQPSLSATNPETDRSSLGKGEPLAAQPGIALISKASLRKSGNHQQEAGLNIRSGQEVPATAMNGAQTVERTPLSTLFPALMPGKEASTTALLADSKPAVPAPNIGSSTATRKPANRKSSWSYGVSADARISGMNDGGMFNFNRASVVDLSGGIANSAFLPSNTVIYRASVIKPEPGFSIGGYASRSIAKKLDVSFGLSFTRFNSSVMVGRKVNSQILVNAGRTGVSSANPYYTREPERKYSMHMDFVEVPVSLVYKFNPSSKLPLSVNAGLIGGRLVGSNALHFDGSSAGYFKNNELLRKWQLGVNAGLALTIMNKSKHPVTVGPSFRYQITNSLSKDVQAKRNILGVGIGVKVGLR